MQSQMQVILSSRYDTSNCNNFIAFRHLLIINNDFMVVFNKWSNQTTNSSNELKLCKIGEHDHKMAIALSLVVKYFTWYLNAHGVDVDGKCCPSISKFSNFLCLLM